jgi:hypothetical protein
MTFYKVPAAGTWPARSRSSDEPSYVSGCRVAGTEGHLTADTPRMGLILQHRDNPSWLSLGDLIRTTETDGMKVPLAILLRPLYDDLWRFFRAWRQHQRRPLE